MKCVTQLESPNLSHMCFTIDDKQMNDVSQSMSQKQLVWKKIAKNQFESSVSSMPVSYCHNLFWLRARCQVGFRHQLIFLFASWLFTFEPYGTQNFERFRRLFTPNFISLRICPHFHCSFIDFKSQPNLALHSGTR